MDSPHALRSKGWAGLAFVLLIIVSIVLGGSPPPANATASTIQAYLIAHHNGLIVGGWLTFPTFAFFLWFVVGVSGYLRRMSANDEGLSAYALVSGLSATVIAIVGGMIGTTLAFVPSALLSPPALQFVWAFSTLANTAFIAMALSVFIFACALSMRRHNSGAPWLVWLGYLTALGEGVMSLGVFYPSGIALDNIAASMVLGFGLFAVWIASTSILLIDQASRQVAGSPA